MKKVLPFLVAGTIALTSCNANLQKQDSTKIEQQENNNSKQKLYSYLEELLSVEGSLVKIENDSQYVRIENKKKNTCLMNITKYHYQEKGQINYKIKFLSPDEILISTIIAVPKDSTEKPYIIITD